MSDIPAPAEIGISTGPIQTLSAATPNALAQGWVQ
jgi:hypothetical protein